MEGLKLSLSFLSLSFALLFVILIQASQFIAPEDSISRDKEALPPPEDHYHRAQDNHIHTRQRKRDTVGMAEGKEQNVEISLGQNIHGRRENLIHEEGMEQEKKRIEEKGQVRKEKLLQDGGQGEQPITEEEGEAGKEPMQEEQVQEQGQKPATRQEQIQGEITKNEEGQEQEPPQEPQHEQTAQEQTPGNEGEEHTQEQRSSEVVGTEASQNEEGGPTQEESGGVVSTEASQSMEGETPQVQSGGVVGEEASQNKTFKTPGLKRHYEMWMKRIMQSDYMKNRNKQRQGRRYEGKRKERKRDLRENEDEMEEEDEGEEEDSEEEEDEDEESEKKIEEKEGAKKLQKRSRAINKIVVPGKRTNIPQPYKVDTSCECGHYNSRRSRIVGGSETKEHHYPWMVSVQLTKGRVHFCGASIITRSYVMTAAHCTEGLFPFELVVRVGDHNLAVRDTSREKTVRVEHIIEHPRYNIETTDNDISLLRLAENLVYTWRVSPICLTPPDFTFYKEIVTVMGWGRRFEKDNAEATILRHVDLKVLPMQKCRYNFLLESEEVTNKMFCAEGGVKDTCQGDSGGPLVYLEHTQNRYFLVGLTSWGVGCGLPKYPGVYTKVSKFLQWLYESTKGSAYCSSYSPKPDKKKIMMYKKKNNGKRRKTGLKKGQRNNRWRYEEISEEENTINDRTGRMVNERGKKNKKTEGTKKREKARTRKIVKNRKGKKSKKGKEKKNRIQGRISKTGKEDKGEKKRNKTWKKKRRFGKGRGRNNMREKRKRRRKEKTMEKERQRVRKGRRKKKGGKGRENKLQEGREKRKRLTGERRRKAKKEGRRRKTGRVERQGGKRRASARREERGSTLGGRRRGKTRRREEEEEDEEEEEEEEDK